MITVTVANFRTDNLMFSIFPDVRIAFTVTGGFHFNSEAPLPMFYTHNFMALTGVQGVKGRYCYGDNEGVAVRETAHF